MNRPFAIRTRNAGSECTRYSNAHVLCCSLQPVSQKQFRLVRVVLAPLTA